MKIKILKIAPAVLVAVLLAIGMFSTQEQAAAADGAATTQSDPMQFARGAKTWADTCARCHNLRDARSLRDDQWRAAVAHMRVRAGMTAKEAEDVLTFLQQSN